MTIAVQTQGGHVSGTFIAAAHAVQRLRDRAGPRRQKIRRHEVVRQKKVARFVAKAGDVERGASPERLDAAHGMDSADEATDPFQGRTIVELRSPAAALGVDRKAKAREGGERASVRERDRRHDRNFTVRELAGESVLLEDLRVGPARRPIELCDDRGGLRRAASAVSSSHTW